jgi:hypothetical protein
LAQRRAGGQAERCGKRSEPHQPRNAKGAVRYEPHPSILPNYRTLPRCVVN